MITAIKPFDNSLRIESAERKQWFSYLTTKYDKVIEELVYSVDELDCMICGRLSLNYTSQGSLANHLRFHERKNVIDFYIDHMLKREAEEFH